MNESAPPLRLLFWESTSRCNLACVHCRRCDVAEELARFDLSTAQVRRMLDGVAELGRPVIVFSGGEPLMRADWRELADHARALGFPTALASNGTLIDAATAEQIAQAGFRRVSISLDGADAATHDAFRAAAGNFQAALAGAARVRGAGVSLQINSTVARHNAGQLDALYDLAVAAGAVALHLFLLVPVGCGVEIADSHRITAEAYEEILGWVADRESAGGLELRATCAPHYFRVAAQRRRGRAAPADRPGPLHTHTRGCLAGVGVAFVSHRGKVFPCGYLPVEAGDITEHSFADIWRHSPLLAELRDFDRLKGRCGRCEYRNVCGGCRARAYGQVGDYLAEEPMCSHQPRL